jgi:cysteinyl-tRNA synthetase
LIILINSSKYSDRWEYRLRIYNSLTGNKEIFRPLKEGVVKMFVCGPTVYDSVHLGHARTYLIYDVLARYLKRNGYFIYFIVNITDIDDKVFERAEKSKVHFTDISEKYTKEFIECLKSINIITINDFLKASDYLDEIKEQIKRLLDNRNAYQVDGDVFFNVSTFDQYGKLSGLQKSELNLRRLDLNPRKKDQKDFQLWRSSMDQYPSFPSGFGNGRPGWHIEDTAISMFNLGEQYDIHGGAMDLIFPHHEAEIAQAESISGIHPFVKYWVHTGLLFVEGKKMSKSLGNFITLREFLKTFNPNSLRLYLLSHHYRKPFNFEAKSLKKFGDKLNLIYDAINHIQTLEVHKKEDLKIDSLYQEYIERFYKAMDNDLDTSTAIDCLIYLLELILKKDSPVNKFVLESLEDMLFIIGISPKQLKK